MQVSQQLPPLPSWFEKIGSDPNQLHKNFRQIFKGKESIQDSKIYELIVIFGRLNLPCLSSYFSSNVIERINAYLKMRRGCFEDSVKHALEDLCNDRQINQEKLRSLSQDSIYASCTFQESIIKGMAEYLLSLSMPLQESIRWKCYRLPAIQKAIDAQQERLNEVIKKIFAINASAQSTKRASLSMTIREESLLFKYAALKGYGNAMSWGKLLFAYSKSSKERNALHQYLEKCFHFDKLSLAKLTLDKSFIFDGISFQEFFVRQMSDLTLYHPNCLLPAELIEEELQLIFVQSLTIQQHFMYFLDYLHSSVKKEKIFSFEEGFDLLNSLFGETDEKINLFLHTCLHFFHCMKQCDADKAQAAFIFKAIYAVYKKEGRLNDEWIYENFKRKPFQINQTFIEYTESRLPLEEIGAILLRVAMTRLNPRRKIVPCLYLSLEKHVKILRYIENNFGVCLPISTIADFLFFQTAKEEIKDALQSFAKIRLAIIHEHLGHLALPSELYKAWESLAAPFISANEINPKGVFPNKQKKLDDYPLKIIELSVLLQFATYPKIMSPFQPFIPQIACEDHFKFEPSQTSKIHYLEPIHEEFETGPARHCRWFFDAQTKQIFFSTSLINSLLNPQIACHFQVVLPGTISAKPWLPTFFMLLNEFIDLFAKEALSDEEDKKMKQASDNPYQLPDECVLVNDEDPIKTFDTIVSHSPFLQHLWDKSELNSIEDRDEIKTTLYTFIKELHCSFKKAFFIVLSKDQAIIEDNIKNLEIFYFNEKSKLEEKSFFERAYEEINHSPYQTETELFKDVSLKMKVEAVSPNDLENKQNLILVSLEINSSQRIVQLPVIYHPFIDKEQYLQLMKWHFKLAEKEFFTLH